MTEGRHAGRVSSSPTLILSRGEVAALMNPAAYLEAVELAFRAAAEGNAHAPPPMTVDGLGGAFHAKGAHLHLDRHYVALKFNGNFPDNPRLRGLPTIQGIILLCDGETGSVLAVIDSIEVTLRRTAAATALAARFLARPQSQSVLICGCGEQAAVQLAALKEVLPLRRCFAWDSDPDRAQAFACQASEGGDLTASAVTELGAAARVSDVIVACTTSRSPYLELAFVQPGTFVAAVGADSPSKNEVQPELMRHAMVVADVLAQCAVMGDLHHALLAGAMRLDDVHAELHELVVGAKSGRTDDAEITLFDSTGTALQDVASAVSIYERACRQRAFRTIDLGAS